MPSVPVEPWKQVVRLPGDADTAPGKRHPVDLDSVIECLDVENQQRYRPRNGWTFCNIYAKDVLMLMGCPFPAVWRSKETTANVMHDALLDGSVGDWKAVTLQQGREEAALGKPVIGVWKNPKSNKPGHVVVLRSDGNLSQAGTKNYKSATVNQCFSRDKLPNVVWWVHE